jgi:hypothetical protein
MRIYVIKHRRVGFFLMNVKITRTRIIIIIISNVLPSNQANVSFVLGEFKHVRVI